MLSTLGGIAGVETSSLFEWLVISLAAADASMASGEAGGAPVIYYLKGNNSRILEKREIVQMQINRITYRSR